AYRADTAVDAFRSAAQSLINAIPADTTQTIAPNLARALLLGVAAFGVPGAVPISPIGTDDTSRRLLHAQAASAAEEVGKRLARIAALTSAYNAGTPTSVDTRNYHVARLREVFGQEFRVLPRFTAVDAATLGRAFAASATLQNN